MLHPQFVGYTRQEIVIVVSKQFGTTLSKLLFSVRNGTYGELVHSVREHRPAAAADDRPGSGKALLRSLWTQGLVWYEGPAREIHMPLLQTRNVQ